MVHPCSSFVTLTYTEEHLPDGNTLVPRHLQLWQKRLRKSLSTPLRFFGVGEYGDQTQRPHYHVAVFGLDPGQVGLVKQSWSSNLGPIGHVHVGTLTFHSAAYIAGYVVKKLTDKNDARLAGRHPEFARMSNRPGIGALAIPQIADALRTKAGWDFIDATGDVPVSLNHGQKSYPLGPYLRKKLREEMGFTDTNCPEEVLEKARNEMSALFLEYVDTTENPPTSLRQYLDVANVVKIRQLEKRSKIFAGVKSL